ncbi:MAG: sigma-54 dependent transcriptional regulator, partial [Spirochaetes bacterium]|nr:sigma-54 dependent transcriptional regulator [Spirochaetota bacterium]
AQTDVPILITGESGTGKELIAQLCHLKSNRHGRFISVNCSALPAGLFESELFGAEKGSYTGAYQQKIGFFELADNGTIFLDEIGELPYEMQAKLLRVLQEKQIIRVGGIEHIKINARIVTATNRNLEEEINKKKFREDLFYRLNVIQLRLPALREREEEIIPLAKKFLKDFCQKYDKQIKGFTSDMEKQMNKYLWPGNIRELRNKIEQAVILSNNEWLNEKDINISTLSNTYSLQKSDLYSSMLNQLPENITIAKKMITEQFEREFICYHLLKNQKNVKQTAEKIGLYRQNLYKRINDLGIDKENIS